MRIIPSGASGRPVLTGRALVLGAVVILLIVLLASPIHRYLGSRRDLGTAGTQLQQDRQQLAKLQKELALWSDPGYIQQQARVRLQYAMPGDTVYVVVDKGQQSDIAKTAGAHGRSAALPGWNKRLWASIQAAGK